MAATMKDIARATGLGLATISSYLNGGNVREKNRLLIEQLEERGRKAVEAGLLSPKELRQALYCRISTFAYVTLQNIIGQRLPYREGKEALKAYRDRARAHRVRLNGNIKRGKRIFAFLLTSFGPYFCYLLMKGASR